MLGSEEEGVKWYSSSCDSRPLARLVSEEGGWSLMAVPSSCPLNWSDRGGMGGVGRDGRDWEGSKMP